MRSKLCTPGFAGSAASLLIVGSVLLLTACGDTAVLDPKVGMGATPNLPKPLSNLIPTVNIAPAVGWPAGATPVPMAGLGVTALSSGVEHPRWVHVLPNGDVLVAESNAPQNPRMAKALKAL